MGTLKTKTFSSGQAAIANARSLQAKGQISKRELQSVERSVDKPKTPPKKR
jgi:hypothetical protein